MDPLLEAINKICEPPLELLNFDQFPRMHSPCHMDEFLRPYLGNVEQISQKTQFWHSFPGKEGPSVNDIFEEEMVAFQVRSSFSFSKASFSYYVSPLVVESRSEREPR